MEDELLYIFFMLQLVKQSSTGRAKVIYSKMTLCACVYLDSSLLKEPDLKMMLISESDDCWCVTVSSRCLWLVSLRHVLRVVIDLPENKGKDFHPNTNQREIPLLRISATCSA